MTSTNTAFWEAVTIILILLLILLFSVIHLGGFNLFGGSSKHPLAGLGGDPDGGRSKKRPTDGAGDTKKPSGSSLAEPAQTPMDRMQGPSGNGDTSNMGKEVNGDQPQAPYGGGEPGTAAPGTGALGTPAPDTAPPGSANSNNSGASATPLVTPVLASPADSPVAPSGQAGMDKDGVAVIPGPQEPPTPGAYSISAVMRDYKTGEAEHGIVIADTDPNSVVRVLQDEPGHGELHIGQ